MFLNRRKRFKRFWQRTFMACAMFATAAAAIFSMMCMVIIFA